ncbi:protein mab-21-like 3 [Mytilus californianus]|uniref:protein mab-21-like 3 n=1 Tax=Mytilus californianus TaxID=6549 RepID=UPI0022481DAF|nr:protein mab-21-like 3 [Mytilus californianus]
MNREPGQGKDPVKVGSFHSYTKVSKANEFDYIILYDTDMVQSWRHVNQPAFYTMDIDKKKIVSSKDQLEIPPLEYTARSQYKGPYNVTENGCLMPLKVKRHFRELVCNAIDYLTKNPKSDAIKIEHLSDSPAVKFTGKQRDGVDLDVDMAPMINVKLPFKHEFGWPKHRAQWPSQEKVQQIKDMGVNLVTSDPLYWTPSFAICEKELLVDIDEDGSCRRRSLRIMKSIRELIWCPGDEAENRYGLTSYHLKNILFFECERKPKDRHWEMELIDKRIISMCKQLLKHLSEKDLPQFFNRSMNLFESKYDQALDSAAKKNRQVFRLFSGIFIEKLQLFI